MSANSAAVNQKPSTQPSGLLKILPKQAAIATDSGPIRYELEWQMCENPTCRCTTISVLATPDPVPESGEEGVLRLQLDADTVGLNDPEAAGPREIALVETWDESDRRTIARSFFDTKKSILKKTDLSKLGADVYFPVEQIEEHGDLVAWDEIIPFGQSLSVEHDQVRFFIDDQYCLKKGCGCQNIVLTFVSAKKIEPGESADESFQGPISSVRFDLKEGVWEPEDVEEGAPVTELMTLALRIKGLKGLLRRRMKTLRSIYRNRLKAIHYRPKPTTLRPTVVDAESAIFPATSPVAPDKSPSADIATVGRNERCPCGSGKKFKKCCLRK